MTWAISAMEWAIPVVGGVAAAGTCPVCTSRAASKARAPLRWYSCSTRAGWPGPGGVAGWRRPRAWMEGLASTQDVMRSQPFSDASTVPDAGGGPAAAGLASGLTSAGLRQLPDAAPLAPGYLAKIAGDPMFRQALGRDGTQGSNEWAGAGSHTLNAHPPRA